MVNRILDELDRAIAEAEADKDQYQKFTAPHILAGGYLQGLRAAREIAVSFFDERFMCKVTSAQHDEIRKRVALGEKQADLAREYGLSPSAVSRIVSRS